MTRALLATLAFIGLVAFSAVLAKLTLSPSPVSVPMAGSNLRPGHSLRQYAEDYTFLAACKQIGGNLLLGAPFGLLLPVLGPRRLRWLRVLMVTGLVMVLVELAQGAIVEGRAFDVDDVILNTGGALLAYVLLGRRIAHRYHALSDPRPTPPPKKTQRKKAPAKKAQPRKASAKKKQPAKAQPKKTPFLKASFKKVPFKKSPFKKAHPAKAKKARPEEPRPKPRSTQG
ncbi:VanZ family protein [Streptomyces sp. NPDC058001]|uniref:VanZ family protein n=1 Tax=Streptomyces sp. NPDC058001 TaxID=3346300 RepID=UPI0036F0DA41